MPLITESNFHEPGKRYFHPYQAGDDFYQVLIDTHRDLSDEESTQVNARLILLLANHIGDLQVLREAMQTARDGGLASPS
jgi:hypothetical protein